MSALATDRNTQARDVALKSYPVAVDIIYKGSLVALNSSGYLVPASDSASDLGVVGVADENVDNSAGSAGDKLCRVGSGRAFKFAATSITQAMVGTMMYVVDDQTFDDAAGATNDVPAGILVEYISSTEGWLYIPECGRQTISGIVNADIANGAAIARAKLAEDVLQPFRIDLGDVLGADFADLAITETAGDFYRNMGTNQMLIMGEVSNGTVGADTEVSVGWFAFQLPQNYVDGGDIKIRAGAKVAGAGALGTCTIDFSAYLQSKTAGTVGSDLVTTAAQAITGTGAAKDFTVDATGLVAGDLLIVKMTTSIDNTNSTAIQSQINSLELLCDVKG